jgi:hypothetical protein
MLPECFFFLIDNKVRMKEWTALFGLGLRGLKLSIGGFNNQLLLGERGPGL